MNVFLAGVIFDVTLVASIVGALLWPRHARREQAREDAAAARARRYLDRCRP